MAEREGSGVARSAQHTVHVLPHASHVIARFLAPALERVTADAEGTQLLIITADGDTALAIAEVARTISDRSPAPVVPLTAAGRGARLASSRVIPAIAAAPSTLASLLRSSAVKLAGVRTVVIAWADELFSAREDEALEIVLAEISKDASRIVVADRMTPEVEALVERHLRRASRMPAPAADESVSSVPVRYVSTVTTGRRSALRRLLDDVDPPSAIVVANDAGGAEEARRAVAALGYESEAAVRVVTTPPEEQTSLVVLYDLPASAAELAQIAAAEPTQVVALVTPRQVPALRRLTTGPVEPLDVSQIPTKARARDERLRATLRAELQSGFPAREIMALEPLLAEFDGLEIAAAALRYFERERADARARRVEPERPAERPAERAVERAPERPAERGERTADRPSDRAPRPSRGGGEFARVFVSIGERDGVRAGDLVGAITGETGITSDRIGKLDIRDSHTVAEIASADAAAVIEKMNGVSLKGRRLTLRVDDRPAPRAREGGRDFGREGGRGGREGGRDARRSGPREGGRGGFGAPRSGAPRSGPREGGRPSYADRGRPSRDSGAGGGGGYSRPGRPPRPAGRDRDTGGERRPRRDDGPPRERGGFRDRPDDGRIPRATREREEWSDRADRVRNARRPRRDEA